MAKYTALIAGVTGAIGSAVARELSAHADWHVFGLSRKPPERRVDGVEYLSVDLADRGQINAQLDPSRAITHVFYCGRVTHAEQVIENPSDASIITRLTTWAAEQA